MSNVLSARSAQRVLATALAGILAAGLLVAMAPAEPVSGATPKACKVRNVTRGVTYGSLAAAVNKARNGNKLTVKGTCKGSTTITDKRLTILGVRTKKSGAPTLFSNGKASVLKIKGPKSVVALKKLSVKGNPNKVLTFEGGGIRVRRGKLTLHNTVVRGFTVSRWAGGISAYFATVKLLGNSTVRNNIAAGHGGGIYAEGHGQIVMTGTSSVQRNVSNNDGAGIDLEGGNLIMFDQSSIVDNHCLPSGDGDGGGVYSEGDTVAMFGSSTIARNSARSGGGVLAQSRLEMSPTSSITDNTARIDGGGLKGVSLFFVPVGVVCAPAPNANVYGNSPDQCDP
jgi:predicted outer membrane repeat protein